MDNPKTQLESSGSPILYCSNREQWRVWLAENFTSATEIWFSFPLKASGLVGVSYNDAVEEALCFGWIDSIIKSLDESYKIQRFTPRRPNSNYSQSNKERLRWLADHGLIHPSLAPEVDRVLEQPFEWPADILQAIQAEPAAWTHFQSCSQSYQRIRVAYIEAARIGPDEFTKRLNHLIARSKAGKKIPGYGGIDKYY